MSISKLELKDSAPLDSALPASKRVYVQGKQHPGVRVPLREISLAATKGLNGVSELNSPVRVYDTRGPWGDPAQSCDPRAGLPALRLPWILDRGDTVPSKRLDRARRAADGAAVSQIHYARKGIVTPEME